MEKELKKKMFEKYDFTCQKCGFRDINKQELEVHHITPKIFEGEESEKNLIVLCSICHHFAPNSKQDFENYLKEKIDWKILETFRKSNRSISKRTKFGMERKAKEGGFITKAPKGYKLVNKQLIPDEKAETIKQIFEEFLNSNISLTQLAKKHDLTTAGIKKLLQNTTYRGKVKFAEQESQGIHRAIIEQDLFSKVQKKLRGL